MKLLPIQLLIIATFLVFIQFVEQSNAEPIAKPHLHNLLKEWHDKHHGDDDSNEDDDKKNHGKHLNHLFPNINDSAHSKQPATNPTIVSQPPANPRAPALPPLNPGSPHTPTGPLIPVGQLPPSVPHSYPTGQTQPFQPPVGSLPPGTPNQWYPPCIYMYPYPGLPYPPYGGVGQSVSDDTGIAGNGNTIKKLFDVGTTINIPIDIF